jgi:hypothetical protein
VFEVSDWVRNVNLLSFDMEEGLDDDSVPSVVIKSSHDLLKDKKLSSRTVLEEDRPVHEKKPTSKVQTKVEEIEEELPTVAEETEEVRVKPERVRSHQEDPEESRNKLAEEYAHMKQQLLEAQQQKEEAEENDGGSSAGRKLLAERKEKYLKKLKGSNPTGDKRTRESNVIF